LVGDQSGLDPQPFGDPENDLANRDRAGIRVHPDFDGELISGISWFVGHSFSPVKHGAQVVCTKGLLFFRQLIEPEESFDHLQKE